MELLIKELNGGLHNIDEDSTQTCLENLHDMILRIREDLKQIGEKIKDHKNKWLNKFRSIDVKPQLYQLRLHATLLDKRYDLLVKTIEITNIIRNNNKKNDNTKLIKNK